ncbi:hypothetical protein evm_000305 [Chilo suppressalis]|nr:hypothetical protein evm_000305 [Chilo suppressalis]
MSFGTNISKKSVNLKLSVGSDPEPLPLAYTKLAQQEVERLKATGSRNAQNEDRLAKRRGSEFPQPVSTPPHQNQAKRRQSSAQVRPNPDERVDKPDPSRVEEPHQVVSPPPPKDYKPDPDTIRVCRNQDSPARRQESPRRLRHEAEPLKRAKGDSPRLSHAHQPRPDHHKSSPNVASRHKTGSPSTREERKSANYSRSDSKRQDSVEQRKMYTASSESELFECAILPIFHKLLTERHKSQPHGLNLSYGVSCPNISIKCDIVEYL